jgi:hypothetical protein
MAQAVAVLNTLRCLWSQAASATGTRSAAGSGRALHSYVAQIAQDTTHLMALVIPRIDRWFGVAATAGERHQAE